MSATRACLVLMYKSPATSKRRLAATVGETNGTAVAQHLLDCALADLAEWPGSRSLAAASEAALRAALPGIPGPAYLLLQPAGNLGERINAVDRALRRAGSDRNIFIGTDCPVLGKDRFLEVEAALETHDVVLAPATDGGVTLMAAAKPWPPLGPLPWSTPALGPALEQACLAAGLSVHAVAGAADVDRAADLDALIAQLAADRRPSRCAFRDFLAAGAPWQGSQATR